jgi:hypothetical protein
MKKLILLLLLVAGCTQPVEPTPIVAVTFAVTDTVEPTMIVTAVPTRTPETPISVVHPRCAPGETNVLKCACWSFNITYTLYSHEIQRSELGDAWVNSCIASGKLPI